MPTTEITRAETSAKSLTTVARGFTQPEQAHLLVPYARRYLAELERLWVTRSGHLRVQLSELLFPYPAVSPELLAQIDDFLTAIPRDPALTRVLTERRDTVQRTPALTSNATLTTARPATQVHHTILGRPTR